MKYQMRGSYVFRAGIERHFYEKVKKKKGYDSGDAHLENSEDVHTV